MTSDIMNTPVFLILTLVDEGIKFVDPPPRTGSVFAVNEIFDK